MIHMPIMNIHHYVQSFLQYRKFLKCIYILEWENGHCDRDEMETMEIRIQMRRLGEKGIAIKNISVQVKAYL